MCIGSSVRTHLASTRHHHEFYLMCSGLQMDLHYSQRQFHEEGQVVDRSTRQMTEYPLW